MQQRFMTDSSFLIRENLKMRDIILRHVQDMQDALRCDFCHSSLGMCAPPCFSRIATFKPLRCGVFRVLPWSRPNQVGKRKTLFTWARGKPVDDYTEST